VRAVNVNASEVAPAGPMSLELKAGKHKGSNRHLLTHPRSSLGFKL
jgi:hypothetical protein